MADATTRWRVMIAAPALFLFAAACGSGSWPGSVASTRTGETEFPSERPAPADPGISDPPARTGPIFGGDVPVTESGYVLAYMVINDKGFYRAGSQIDAARVYMVYQASGETNGKYDEAKFRRSVGKRVPPGWKGLAMLDFEGHWLTDLEALPNTPRFKKGEAAMLRLLEVAREIRPEAKWSVYGLPNLPFWIKDDNGKGCGWNRGSAESKRAALTRAARAARVAQACDWVSPSIYDPYLDEVKGDSSAAQQALAEAETRLAIQMANGKPVLPTIWHRVHQSNKKDGLRLFSPREWFEDQALAALRAGADGVTWWGADRYFARTGELRKRHPQEFQGIEGNDSPQMHEYLLTMHIARLYALNDALTAYARSRKAVSGTR